MHWFLFAKLLFTFFRPSWFGPRKRVRYRHSYLVYKVHQTAAFGEKSWEAPVRFIRKHLHNGKAHYDLKVISMTPFHTANRPNWDTSGVYATKVWRVHEPFASHISCMTAFHHRGRLDEEIRSYLREVLPAKCVTNGIQYFLTLLWHHNTRQLLWVSGSLLFGISQHMWMRISNNPLVTVTW